MKYNLLLIAAFILFKVDAQKLQATDSTAVLNVTVANRNNKSQEGEAITFESVKTGKLYSGTTNAEGKFSIIVPQGQKFKVQYKAFTSNEDYKTLEVPKVGGPLNFAYTITVEQPKVYTLNNVFFDTGKSTLRNESFKELNELAEYMTRKKSLVIEIAGHTDNVGSEEANLKLSNDRANTVRQYLIQKGIAANRVSAKGYGASQPVADNDTPQGKQKNRRTEVRIISE